MSTVELSHKDYLETEGRLTFIAAKQTDVVVSTPTGAIQICQILFHKKDGSIFVQTPHYRKREGIVARFEVPEGIVGTADYKFHENGKVTSHLVKFSHHPDGRVHFSQDGKVRTEIVRQSFPLTDPVGTVFDIQAFFLAGFERIVSAKPRRAYIGFQFDHIPFGIVVRGQWYNKADFQADVNPPGALMGPTAYKTNPQTGESSAMYFLGQPKGYPLRDHILLLSLAAVKMPNATDRETLIITGGFDRAAMGVPPRNHTGFVAALYPIADISETRDRIGSIDIT